MTPQAERKREASIASQVAAMRARRDAEQDKLRAILADIVERRDALKEREIEVRAMLGETVVHVTQNGAADAHDDLVVECFDCDAKIELAAPGASLKECPVCRVSPFEAKRR